MTGWTVLGLEAAGRNPHDLKKGGRTPIDFMRAGARQLDDAAELSRTVLALRAAGSPVRDFNGRDLLAELERRQRGDGSFQGQAPTTAFAIMALRAAGRSSGSGSVRRATGWLAAQQNSDGGFSNGNKGGASDVDDAGAALQGLAAGGRGSGGGVKRAVRFIAGAQNADGGVGQFRDSRSNAQSAAWAAQGLVAVGRKPSKLTEGGRSLLGYLSSLQQSDGSYRYSRTSTQTPVWVTAQVLAAVSGKAFPLARVPRQGRARATAASAAPQASGGPSSNDLRPFAEEGRSGGGRADRPVLLGRSGRGRGRPGPTVLRRDDDRVRRRDRRETRTTPPGFGASGSPASRWSRRSPPATCCAAAKTSIADPSHIGSLRLRCDRDLTRWRTSSRTPSTWS